MFVSLFFRNLKPHNQTKQFLSFLQKRSPVRKFLEQIGANPGSNYLYNTYSDVLTAYSNSRPGVIAGYLHHQLSFEDTYQNFINFCFSNNLHHRMNKDSALSSFKEHDELSDNAIRNELAKREFTPSLNLLGFGCGDGSYEKALANFLLTQGLTDQVNIYGYDPYAPKDDCDIDFISEQQLQSKAIPQFDVVSARWVLHHVELQNRWDNLIHCMNKTSPNGLILIIEHGLVSRPLDSTDSKLYKFLNVTFDIVANIGIRPEYVSQHFFLSYLKPGDINFLTTHVNTKLKATTYDVGPAFPNQTICCLKMS